MMIFKIFLALQMYSFHGGAYETTFPFVYSLLTHKDEAMYRAVLSVILRAIEVKIYMYTYFNIYIGGPVLLQK